MAVLIQILFSALPTFGLAMKEFAGYRGSLNQLLRAGVVNGHGFRSSALQGYLASLPIEL